MAITTNKKHNKHTVTVDYNWRNAHGQPALVCTECKRKGKPTWIQWISKKEEHLVFKYTV